MVLAGSQQLRAQDPAPVYVIQMGLSAHRDGREKTVAVTGTGAGTGNEDEGRIGAGTGAEAEAGTVTERRLEGRESPRTLDVILFMYGNNLQQGMDQPGKITNPVRGQLMNVSLSPLAPENLVSRDEFGRPVPRQPANFPHSG